GDDQAAEAEVADVDAAVGMQRPDRSRHEPVETAPAGRGPDLRDARGVVVRRDEVLKLDRPPQQRAEVDVPDAVDPCDHPIAMRPERLGKYPQRLRMDVIPKELLA